MAYLFANTSSLAGAIDGCACHACRTAGESLSAYGDASPFGGGDCASCGPSCGCGPCRTKHGGLAEWYIKEDDDADADEPPQRSQAVKSPARIEGTGMGQGLYFPHLYPLPRRGRGWGEGRFGLAPALAIPAAPVITVGVVLEAIAFVLSALAAAYLLIKAYEAARDRGFGVALATQALSAGLGALIDAGRKMADGLRRILEKAKQYGNRGPRCRDAIERVMRTLGEIIRTLTDLETAKNEAVPNVLELRRLMRQLGNWMKLAKSEVAFLIQSCGPIMTR